MVTGINRIKEPTKSNGTNVFNCESFADYILSNIQPGPEWMDQEEEEESITFDSSYGYSDAKDPIISIKQPVDLLYQ